MLFLRQNIRKKDCFETDFIVYTPTYRRRM